MVITPGALTAASSIEHTFMMTLDHVGDLEAMVHAQLSQQPLAHTTETSLQPRQGTRSCLSAQPPDLATVTAAQPKVACVRPSIVLFLYSKRTALTRSLVSGWTIERFVAITSQPAVELPCCTKSQSTASCALPSISRR